MNGEQITQAVQQTVMVPGSGPLNLTVNVVRVPESRRDSITHPLLVAANEERVRQIDHLEYTPEHDADHTRGELADAAACYAIDPDNRQLTVKYGRSVPVDWPFGHRQWEPKDRSRDLVRAVALLMAEYDRLKEIQEIENEENMGDDL